MDFDSFSSVLVHIGAVSRRFTRSETINLRQCTHHDPLYDSQSQPLESPHAGEISWCFRRSMPPKPIMHVSDARGWPMLAMRGGLDLIPAGGGCWDVSRTYWTVAVMEPDGMRWLYPSVDYKQRLIPASPIWPGFYVNTALYGTIWFGLWLILFFGLTATRRTIRRRRGHCPNCNYDLRGDFDNGCSECGWGRELQPPE